MSNIAEKKFRLPKVFAEQWVSALRSGEYPQATGLLKSSDGYCCLGVACKIAGVEDDKLDRGTIPTGKGVSSYTSRPFESLPEELRGDPDCTKNFSTTLVSVLVNMNDSLDKNFNEIADYIESEVEFY